MSEHSLPADLLGYTLLSNSSFDSSLVSHLMGDSSLVSHLMGEGDEFPIVVDKTQ